jgi:hypothetical protein
MSNFLAVATVTETLRQMLQAAVDNDLPGASVTTARPENQGNGPQGSRINVFLYQVSPNPALRNDDLPTRNAGATLVDRPCAALNLHYLFSFSGDDTQLEPQRLLGTAIRTLHGRPLLTRQMVTDALANTTLGFLTQSNLVDQVELVKLTPTSLSLEELSKLWSVLFQTPFVLSVAYEAAVVLLEEDVSLFRPLPVRARNLRVVPFSQPVIEQVRASSGAFDPIVAGTTIQLLGRNLQGDVTRVRVGGRIVTPATSSDSEVTVALTAPTFPAASLRAGVQGVQVVQQVLFDVPTDPHRGFESNVAPFVLRPRITGASFVGDILHVDVEPPIGKGQRVTVLLNEVAAPDPAAHAYAGITPVADTSSIEVLAAGLANAEYFVRIQVDGAESPIELDPTLPSFGPLVTFP